jgi:hypothetical protein
MAKLNTLRLAETRMRLDRLPAVFFTALNH